MATGYWKATGSPGYVYSSDNKVIGVKKSMIFYMGKPSTGRKTHWKLNLYRAIELSPTNLDSTSSNISIPKVIVSRNSDLYFNFFKQRTDKITSRV